MMLQMAPKPALSAAQMRRHVYSLARGKSIRFHWRPERRNATVYWWAGEGGKTSRFIHIYGPPPTTRWRYLMVLHEIGHAIGRGRSARRRLDQEPWAWLYALEQSLVEVRPVEYRSILRRLQGYHLYRDGHYWKPPREDGIFWIFLEDVAGAI